MERESLGIKGADAMIEGGLPNTGIYGLWGPPGVGKSIFTLHYLLEGARKGQKCLYINLEEPIDNVYRMIEEFSFAEEVKKYIKKGYIILRCYTYPEFEKIHEELLKKIYDEGSTQRLVIDSFNGFFNYMYAPDSTGGNINARKAINHSFSYMRRNGMTALLTIEAEANFPGLNYNLSFLVDGMIELDFLDLGAIERRIFVKKMRWTNQYRESKDFDINEDGIQVLDDKE